MQNTITAIIEFYFKGEKFEPCITIDLNDYLQSNCNLPNFHSLIATANNIDHYSYEYEMMQAEKIIFSNAKGLIANFVVDNEINLEAFQIAWQENNTLDKLRVIAERNMNMVNFEQHPELKKTLLDAYHLGKQDK